MTKPKTEPKTGEKSDRELLLGVHEKLDTMLASYRRILHDRLLDRDVIQRLSRRVESLENQVSYLTLQNPNNKPWRPSAADLQTGRFKAIGIDDLEAAADDEGDKE